MIVKAIYKNELFYTINDIKNKIFSEILKNKETECCNVTPSKRDYSEETYRIVKNMDIDRKIKEHKDIINKLERELKDRTSDIMYLEQSRYN